MKRQNQNEKSGLAKRGIGKTGAAKLAVLALSGLLLCGLSVPASGAGDASDPLVTLSYLNDKFLPEVLLTVREEVRARNETMLAELSKSGAAGNASASRTSSASSSSSSNDGFFVAVTLRRGETAKRALGSDWLLRSGSAVCTAIGNPGFADETDGTTLSSGMPLAANHLYLALEDGCGVTAGEDGTVLLLRSAGNA